MESIGAIVIRDSILFYIIFYSLIILVLGFAINKFWAYRKAACTTGTEVNVYFVNNFPTAITYLKYSIPLTVLGFTMGIALAAMKIALIILKF